MAAARSAQLDEALEQTQVLHLDELAHIAFDIGHDVIGKPMHRRQLAVMDRRIQAAPHQIVQPRHRQRALLQFFQRERQQLHHAHPTGQRLRDVGEQPKLLRADEHELAHALVGIDAGLQVGKQHRAALCFIQDGTLGEAVQKTARVFFGKGAFIGVFQRHIAFVGKGHLRQRGLASLTRAGDGQNGITHGELQENAGSLARDHFYKLEIKLSNCKNILFHFLMPGFLDSQKRFTGLFRNPIEKQGKPRWPTTCTAARSAAGSRCLAKTISRSCSNHSLFDSYKTLCNKDYRLI